jgi:hypothetical protein
MVLITRTCRLSGLLVKRAYIGSYFSRSYTTFTNEARSLPPTQPSQQQTQPKQTQFQHQQPKQQQQQQFKSNPTNTQSQSFSDTPQQHSNSSPQAQPNKGNFEIFQPRISVVCVYKKKLYQKNTSTKNIEKRI